ncbi:MAG TPA: hypothetical protein DCG12_20765, partial [Planctomycetaceae bacterium]|nr:hypothetical protein [Planctomycetaceae bacterium]
MWYVFEPARMHQLSFLLSTAQKCKPVTCNNLWTSKTATGGTWPSESSCKLLQKHCPAPGRLVEGGIGSGRNLIEFEKLGYDVAGYDLMPESVAHVQERGIPDAR